MLTSRLLTARARARPGLCRTLIRPITPHAPSARRSFANGSDGLYGHHHAQHLVPLLRPLAWAAAAVGTIYFTCAAYDVWQDLTRFPAEDRHGLTFEELESEHARRWGRKALSRSIFTPGPIVAGSLGSVWDNLSGPSKVMAGLTLVNLGVLGLSKSRSPAAQSYFNRLAHIPASPWFKSPQLLTSIFAHTGFLHLGLNMMVLFNFGPQIAASPPISGSGSHFLAFYLSTGVLASLGAQAAALVAKKSRYSFGLGASGAVLGVFAAWAAGNPTAEVGIFPLPWVFQARDLLQWEAVFEALGVLGVWRALRLPINIGHSVHLAGIGVGAAYVTYDKKAQAWATSRRAAFRSMKIVGIV